jgi:ABC-type glycerol-3-phosphate transport system permease component
MESHKRILGIIYTVTSIISILIALLLNVFLSALWTFVISQASHEDQLPLEFLSLLFQYLPWIIIIFSVPSLIAGLGLLNKASWAMMLALILGCLKLISFPVGTAIGVYTIWVYSEDQKVAKTAAVN